MTSVTAWLAGSRTTISEASLETTQTRPSGATASDRGSGPTGISATFTSVDAAITVAVSLSGFTFQISSRVGWKTTLDELSRRTLSSAGSMAAS
jgi:hypothetical protein